MAAFVFGVRGLVLEGDGKLSHSKKAIALPKGSRAPKRLRLGEILRPARRDAASHQAWGEISVQ